MQTTRFRALILTVLALAPVACNSSRDADSGQAAVTTRPRILKDIPVLRGSRHLDTTGSVDAERSTWMVAARLDAVAAHYRNVLPALGWSIMSDRGDSSVVDLYSRKPGLALWMHFERQPVGPLYTLIGTAAPDSTGVVAPGQASPSAKRP